MKLFNLKLVNFIGYFAAICTTVAFVPQVIKVYQTRTEMFAKKTFFIYRRRHFPNLRTILFIFLIEQT